MRIKREHLTPKMREEYETFEPIFAKGISSSIALYILGVIPLIITSAIATAKIVNLCMIRNKFKDGMK